MKMKFIAVAVAATCAQSAFALDALVTKSIQNGTLANSHAVYMSGASALKKSVPLAFAKLCSDAVTTFNSSADASNVFAYSCTIKSVAQLAAENISGLDAWATHKVLLGLSVQNGSLTAVLGQNASDLVLADGTTHAQNLQINFANVTSAATTTIADTVRKQTIGGFMDVNPELFSDVIAGVSGLSVSYTTTPAAAGQLFGIAVSPKLYTALQLSQGLIGGTVAAPTGACVSNKSLACQPSITKGQYASLIAQQNAGFIADFSALGTSVSPVNLCRRVQTSGTQAGSNNFFLGKGCSTGGVLPAALADASAGVFNISEGSGTGNAVSCLSDSTVGKEYAIGVLSAENASASSVWSFIKLDGVGFYDGSETTPGKSRQAAIDQKYDYAYEFVTVTRNSASAQEQALLAGISSAISDPTITDLVGIYVAPGNAAGKTNVDLPSQVSKASRSGNACSPSLFVF